MSNKNQENGSNPLTSDEDLNEEQRSALESRRRFVRNTLVAGGLLAASGVMTNTGVRPVFANGIIGTTPSPIPALSVGGLAALSAALAGGVLIAKNKRNANSPDGAGNIEESDNSE
ncbi:MAG: hypothetical protein ACRESZ_04425 [Methylococcales bacterium]